MKKTFLAITLFISLASFGQGTAVNQDTAALRKEQEAINKFVENLVAKTTMADFQKWVYENLPAKKNDEFLEVYRFFINQKYAATKK